MVIKYAAKIVKLKKFSLVHSIKIISNQTLNLNLNMLYTILKLKLKINWKNNVVEMKLIINNNFRIKIQFNKMDVLICVKKNLHDVMKDKDMKKSVQNNKMFA